jgi:dolichyl-phosphate-mannose--protein O-mannosyl transferase
MFDEIHYLPAVRNLLALSAPVNQEHPLVAKEAMALGFAVFGDNAFGWRITNAVLGTLGLCAAIRTMWWVSLSRSATLLFGGFLATNFVWFVLSRIAMLDMAMAAALACAFWQCALACRKPRRGRLHLALAGVFLGLSLGAKWNGIPLAVLPGIGFAIARWRAGDGPFGTGRLRAWLTARNSAPVPGLSLIEAALWLGSVPLLVYFASFAPMFLYHTGHLTSPAQLLPYQQTMLRLQDSVVKPHRYMSHWWQWMFNLRPIWFLYQNVDGAQRGVIMLGNPFTMLAGLPALMLCAWDGVRSGSRLRQALVVLYIASLIFWAINGKPVQFYYHYLLASVFAAAALAVVLGAWWDRGSRWPGGVALLAALAMFAWFYPILSAGALADKKSYIAWMWLNSWR